MGISENGESFGELIEHGGIYYKVPGANPKEALTALIGFLPRQEAIQNETLLNAVLEREALMSTSIGRGIALPHPRNPAVSKSEDQFAALAFLEHPVDWNALDGRPVDTLILIVSASAKLHLHTLSKITFFCQQDAFLKLLKKRVPKEDIIKFIKDTERDWK
ncbi:PTS sugar transporter subunit IIA [Leadbettera azotonutricia]|uniref:Putative phosphoenolpyruvate-dependent sugar phosphotransferase system, eiia 2 n=1 Tax=Leadbettera azotonutricia (strain ATCC BAA-888 / DSM 13862 / ZAS-9) TaxID=545695 RepID=F5YC31_LEAAZ|nr:PTS sugar transporter subunit IIA [Leadbettera azotonutricia]AEF82603.1 putative phosphoenolpyruvate-dependent sugar phosphotransferase system, eiia 2 [Leadbettera azotonutricia ZAS-9]